MQERIIGLYIFLLRTAGAYAGAFSVMFFASLGSNTATGLELIMPVLGNLLALGIAIGIAMPPITRERLTPKAQKGELISLIVPLALLPFLFVLPSWTAVSALQLGEELTHTVTVLASIPAVLLAGLAWVIAFGLHTAAKTRAQIDDADQQADIGDMMPAE